MFILANLITALANILEIALTVLYWLILVRALISWVNPDPLNPLVQFLYKATEPVLQPIRRMLPFTMNVGLDLSPLLAFLIIFFLKSFLVRTLLDISWRVSS